MSFSLNVTTKGRIGTYQETFLISIDFVEHRSCSFCSDKGSAVIDQLNGDCVIVLKVRPAEFKNLVEQIYCGG